MSTIYTTRGQLTTQTLVANTIVNVCGATDEGIGQNRTLVCTVIGAGTVYFKVVNSTDTLTGLVSSTDYESALTSSDDATSFLLAPNTMLICVSAGTPNVNCREIIYV